MPTPAVKDYAVDLPLTNLSIGYRVEGTIARDVVTRVPVSKENGKYHKWTKADIFRLPNTRRAAGAEANEITAAKTQLAYLCNEESLKIALPYRERDNADSILNIRTAKMQIAQDMLELRLEKAVAALYADASVPSTTLTTTAQWQVSGGGDGSTSNPELDIDIGKESIRKLTGGKNPNIIVIPSAVAKIFKRHGKIQSRVIYTHANLLQDDDLPPTLWGMKTFMPRPVEVTSKEEAATTTFADVWGDVVYMAYINPIPDASVLTAFSMFDNLQEVRVYDVPSRKSEFIEPSQIYDLQIVDADAAYAIKDTSALF